MKESSYTINFSPKHGWVNTRWNVATKESRQVIPSISAHSMDEWIHDGIWPWKNQTGYAINFCPQHGLVNRQWPWKNQIIPPISAHNMDEWIHDGIWPRKNQRGYIINICPQHGLVNTRWNMATKESDMLYHQFLPTAWISEYTMEYGHERTRQVMPSISAHSMDEWIHDGMLPRKNQVIPSISAHSMD